MARRKVRVEFEDDLGRPVVYHRQQVGGGLVSPRAHVDDTASLAREAYVEEGAHVGARTRVGVGSWIDVDARLDHDVVVGRNVHVGRRTMVGARARLEDGSRLGADVTVESGAHVHPDTVIPDGAVVRRDGRRRYGIAA